MDFEVIRTKLRPRCSAQVILDEPTNYLDRESLGALADAIREFEGGVVIISHNNDFTTALCPETWVVEKDEDEVRSRRPVVWRRRHFLDMSRLQE